MSLQNPPFPPPPRLPRLVPRFPYLLLTLAGLASASCAPLHRARLRQSESFYRSTTAEAFPPRSPETPIPLLDVRPKDSRVIGRFPFSTLRGPQFAIEAAQHNARRVGADSVLVRKLEEKTEAFSYYVPPETIYIPQTHLVPGARWVPGGPPGTGPGYWAPCNRLVTSPFLQYRPGRVVSGTQQRTYLEAEMLRKK
ncbi:MAG: hypothetical protein RLZZ244_2447 [Verrucomicrobiota bacterium]